MIAEEKPRLTLIPSHHQQQLTLEQRMWLWNEVIILSGKQLNITWAGAGPDSLVNQALQLS